MGIVKATALNYAKKNFKHDPQFIDECIAEAYFWLVVLFNEFKEEISKQDDPLAYIRMRIGYKLKEYWAPYASSTMSFVKKKGGVIPQTIELTNAQLARQDSALECFICLQSVLTRQIEWDIYEQYILNKTTRQIALVVELNPKRVKHILSKIKKKLKKLKNNRKCE